MSQVTSRSDAEYDLHVANGNHVPTPNIATPSTTSPPATRSKTPSSEASFEEQNGFLVVGVRKDKTNDCEVQESLVPHHHTRPPLFEAMMNDEVGVFLTFGGQGSAYFDELSELYHADNAIAALVELCSARLVREADHAELQTLKYFARYGIDVATWITRPDTAPPEHYLISAPVSSPLIGLTQLAQYVYCVQQSGIPFHDFVRRVKGATGHDQGLMTAAIVGTSSCETALAANAEHMVAYMLWHGARLQALVHKFVPTKDEDAQHFMLSVHGMSRAALCNMLEKQMKMLRLSVSLDHGRESFVVCGTPDALRESRTRLEKMSAPFDNHAQNRVPFSKRKPIIYTKWMKTTVPFHHTMFHHAESLFLKDAQRLQFVFPPSSFLFPVYGTNHAAEDLSSITMCDDVFPRLLSMLASTCLVWTSAIRCATNAHGVTHVLDFGPGGTSGAGVLTQRLVEGAGVQVIHVSDPAERKTLLRAGEEAEGTTRRKTVQYADNWARLFGPRVVTRHGDGKKNVVSTKWTALTGKPPIMISGMTPSTSFHGLHLVAAASNSGFHCELAAAGMPSQAMFEERVKKLRFMLDDGVGIVLNMLYLSAKQWAFQFPAALRMRATGIPIESITIGAGVPSLERGNDIVQQMRACGMRYISLKPGSMDAINGVLDIAAANPSFGVVLQWTGGRAGGHHSFEDMHDPILRAYARIRALANVVLVAGSGFGDSTGSLPYLTGEWSTAFGYPPMPFDCVLVASRVMVAHEAATATAVKEILVATPGIGADQATWETSYDGNAGGIITVKSELGEAIHVVGTRGMLLWREFDTTFFTLPAKDRHAAVVSNKEYIIKRINEDYAKVYFGQKENGAVCDLRDMTYAEVIHRFVALCYIDPDKEVETTRHERWTPEGRWIDVTYMTRLKSWFHRCEAHVNAGHASFLRAPLDLATRPLDAIRAFLTQFPQLSDMPLTAEDIDEFLHLCKTGGKPVPFIPIIDGEFEVWFKKDSLWYSEDIAAVPEHDAQRVCILQGPVSVTHSTVMNEPVAVILNNILDGWKQALEAAPCAAAVYSPATQDPEMCTQNEDVTAHPAVTCASQCEGETIEVYLSNEGPLPDEMLWRAFLGGTEDTWMKALLTNTILVRGKEWVPNVFGSLFKPRYGQKVRILRPLTRSEEYSVEVFDTRIDAHGHPVLDARLRDDVVTVTIHDVRPATSDAPQHTVPLRFYFVYRPDQPFTSLHQHPGFDTTDQVRQYFQLCCSAVNWDDVRDASTDIRATHRATFCITQRDVDDFKVAIATDAHAAMTAPRGDASTRTTHDFCTVAAWKPLLMCVGAPTLRGHMVDLLHVSNEVTILDARDTSGNDRSTLRVGDTLHTAMRITEITNTARGKVVKCVGTLTRQEDSEPMLELTSCFLFRGKFTDFQHCFKQETRVAVVDVRDDTCAAILRSKNWFHVMEGEDIIKGDRLEFSISREDTFTTSHATMRSTARGTVRRQATGALVASIRWEMDNVAGNAVFGFLDRWESIENKSVFFENGGYTMLSNVDIVTAPSSNIPYASASRDLNPIYRNPYIANVVGLSSTAVHGAWTAANARRVLERVAGSPNDIRSYVAVFERMVTASEVLYTQVTHIGNKNGQMIVAVDTCNESGDIVLKGRAVIAFPRAAIMFTGQGSESKGMGMDLYERSASAKATWDTADKYLFDKYGFSILDIVRRNPKSHTVYFGGKKGAAMRCVYMKLTNVDANGKEQPAFPSVHDMQNMSYTFRGEQGLLYRSLFAQPALTLMELAAYNDMKDHGLVPLDHYVVGHSLGEYAAVAASANAIPVELVVELQFLNSVSLEHIVPRDDRGRSDFGMVAASPMRVGEHFTEHHLKHILTMIEEKTDMLAETVNYNVYGTQYVVTGNLQALVTLGEVMTHLHENPARMESLDELVSTVLGTVRKRACELSARGDVLTLERGKATIPLVGLDTPFHSKYLLPTVHANRRRLIEVIGHACNTASLVGRYVPNLTATPFSISKEYVTLVFKHTNSPILRDILSDWTSGEPPSHGLSLGTTILFELFTYQYASAVLWSDTMKYFFSEGNVYRVVEIGPVPTLKPMAVGTLMSGAYGPPTARTVLHYTQDNDTIFFQIKNRGPSCEEAAKAGVPLAPPSEDAEDEWKPWEVGPTERRNTPTLATPKRTNTSSPPRSATPPPPARPSKLGRTVPDCPVTALESLQVLIATKVKKHVADVAASLGIKDFCGGKDKLQAEILTDLRKEFGHVPEINAATPLREVAKGFSAYCALGPYMKDNVTALFASTMPLGFELAAVKHYLAAHFNLGPGRIDGVLLHALSLLKPTARLSNESDAHAWLDGAVESYATKMDITLRKNATSMPAMPAVMRPVVRSPAVSPPQLISDASLSAIEFLKTILALQLKIPITSITDDTTLKEVTGGKSATRNELLADITSELGDIPELENEDLSIADVAKLFPNYSTLGKVSGKLLSKMLSSKMPGGFGMSVIQAHLTKERLLPPGRVQSVLLHSLTMQPDSLLADEKSAIAWLNSVVDSFGASHNLTIPHATRMENIDTTSAMPFSGSCVVSSTELAAVEKRLQRLMEDTIDSQLEFLKKDKHSAVRERDAECLLRKTAEKELETWAAEHDEFYAAGITPVFSAEKQRTYDSYWNWARTDVLRVYHAWLVHRSKHNGDDSDMLSPEIAMLIANRGNAELVGIVDVLLGSLAEKDAPLKQFFEQVKNAIAESVVNDSPPACRALFKSLAPRTSVGDDGRLTYDEVPRPGISCVVDYIAEMKRGVQRDISSALTKEFISERKAHRHQPETMKFVPHVCVETVNPKEPSRRVVDREACEDYFAAMTDLAHSGITLCGKVVVVTGCGSGSIGIELIKFLLQAGAHVLATTSSFSLERTQFFRTIYEENCARGAVLTVLPFNQGSVQDVMSLVSHVYDVLQLDVNAVVPFAAISEDGSDVSGIEGRSELSHRVMLTNTVRLLGAIRSKKEEKGFRTSPAMVLLPLSPNHGLFGNDGLYAESKLALEALLAKWCSESWSDYLSIVGAVIGWTRGTGLMSGNNMIAEGIEKLGLRTFSRTEMAFNLMALFHLSIVSLSHECPVVVSFGSRFDMVHDLKGVSAAIRADLYARAATRRGIRTDNVADNAVINSAHADHEAPIQQAARVHGAAFPPLPSRARVSELGSQLNGMVDLAQVVVCVGYGEVGPWGSARTRWEMESYGHLSLEGCIELAWILGFIRYHDGPLLSHAHYIGWVDTRTDTPVRALDVKARYEEEMLSLSGVRVLDIFSADSPKFKEMFHRVALDRDMKPFEVSTELEAQEFQRRIGADMCYIYKHENDAHWCVQVKKGAELSLARAIQFDSFFAAQIPRGWSAKRLGLTDKLIDTLDPKTLYVLVSTMEACMAAGVTDPYEFYRYIHVTDLGNSVGGALCGLKKVHGVFPRPEVRNVNNLYPSDNLQEVFLNTSAAWINLLLLSSSGPIHTPCGACASAAESVDLGMRMIERGTASIVLAGACDDIDETSVYEFGNMKVTANSHAELAMGRDPREVSRPCASSRRGFVESHGAGTQLLMSAELALQMGVPIYAIVAHAATASDKEGRDVRECGKGILTTAREVARTVETDVDPLLSVAYRRRRLDGEIVHLEARYRRELGYINDQAAQLPNEKDARAYRDESVATLNREMEATRKSMKHRWGNEFFINEPRIAPLRGALAVWGLGVDDISMASYHAVGSLDTNESAVTHAQMEHLGRTPGKPLYVVAQKSVTGHSKGAAAAWMFNGCIQAMHTQCIPGNYNLDNAAAELQQYSHVVFPNKPITLGTPILACILKSFGYAQKNAEILLVHPDYVFSVESELFEPYVARRALRERQAFRYMQDVLAGKRLLVDIKTKPPYSRDMEEKVYLNPLLRARYDAATDTYTFNETEAEADADEAGQNCT